MKGLEPFKPGLKNPSLDRFAFIPVSAREENRTLRILILSQKCLPVASLAQMVAGVRVELTKASL
jgi:hypothetical protein